MHQVPKAGPSLFAVTLLGCTGASASGPLTVPDVHNPEPYTQTLAGSGCRVR